MVNFSLVNSLNHLVTLYSESSQLRLYLFSYTPLKLSQENLLHSSLKKRPLHVDHKMAFLSSLATFIAMMSICLFWIATAWPNGDTAAQLAAIACCFFASQFDPVPLIVLFIYCVIATIPIGALYLFAILPRVDGFFMLVLVFAPFYLFFGYLIASSPRTAFIGVAAILALTNLVLLQQQYTADFAVYLNVCIALLTGMGTAALSNHIFRSMGREWNIRHLLSSIRYDLANIATAAKPANEAVFTLRTIDRLGMLTPLKFNLEDERLTLNGISALSVGRYIILLQSTLGTLPTHVNFLIRNLLDELSQRFRSYQFDQESPSLPLLNLIDTALTDITALTETAARTDTLLALCGLRRNLFPDALPYQPSIKGNDA